MTEIREFTWDAEKKAITRDEGKTNPKYERSTHINPFPWGLRSKSPAIKSGQSVVSVICPKSLSKTHCRHQSWDQMQNKTGKSKKKMGKPDKQVVNRKIHRVWFMAACTDIQISILQGMSVRGTQSRLLWHHGLFLITRDWFSWKQGRIHGKTFADGWAGAIMREPLAI